MIKRKFWKGDPHWQEDWPAAWMTLKFMRVMLVAYVWIAALLFTLGRMGGRPKRDGPANTEKIGLPATFPPLPPRPRETGSSFQRTMDSIRSHAALEKEFDSLMKTRPGFADTIRQLEVLYPRK